MWPVGRHGRPVFRRLFPASMSAALAHHLIVPFASASSSGCQQALQQLSLGNLPALLDRLQADPVWECDEYSYSTPHEHKLAEALQWPQDLRQDGQMPWAAHTARLLGVASKLPTAWGLVTLCHWQIHADHVTMAHPAELALKPEEAHSLCESMQPWFAEEGLHLVELPVDKSGIVQWLAHGRMLENLRTASLDRVCGRNVESWMPTSTRASTSPTAARAAPLQRLQSEMQMLLYTHPVNERRLAHNELPVNSFWVSGAGILPTEVPVLPEAEDALQPHLLRQLVTPAQREDWQAWLTAWKWLDEAVFGPLLQRHKEGKVQRLRITLCSERRAMTWNAAPVSLLQKAGRALRPSRASTLLKAL